MNEQLLDTLDNVAAEFASPLSSSEHFILDRLEQYPGKLPFPVQPTPPGNQPDPVAEAPLRIDPELAATLADDIERRHTVRRSSAEDPLEELAAKLDTIISLSTQPNTAVSPVEEFSSEPEGTSVTTAEVETASQDSLPQAARGSLQRRILTIALMIVMLLGGGAGLLFLLPYLRHYSTITPLPDTLKGASTEHITAPTSLLPQPSESNDQHSTTAHRDSAGVSHSTDTRDIANKNLFHPGDTLSPRKTRSRPLVTQSQKHPIVSRSYRSQTEPTLTIVSPPAIAYPRSEGQFAIQVCSTPSYAEALRWKERLQQLNMQPVSILPYQVRGNTYYRVRIGTFPSQIAAQQAVLAMGLNPASIWIVRIE